MGVDKAGYGQMILTVNDLTGTERIGNIANSGNVLSVQHDIGKRCRAIRHNNINILY